MSFSPPCSPFVRQNVKNFPITGLSFPHKSTFLAKKKIIGTGSIFPIIATIYEVGILSLYKTAYGNAPLSSISGTIEIKKTIKYFFIISTSFIFSRSIPYLLRNTRYRNTTIIYHTTTFSNCILAMIFRINLIRSAPARA